MPATCLSPHEIERFSLGRLTAAAQREVEAHVEGCRECGDALAAADRVDDSLVRMLRSPGGGGPQGVDAGGAEYARAAAVARRLAAGGSEPGGGDPLDAPAGRVAAPELRQLRDYRLLRKLGEGGMGTVYKALHVRLDRVFALKVLPPDRVHDANAIARFEREMRAAGRFDHPAIVRATDAGELDGTHYLVMEYVEGLDLSRLVERCGPLPVADACEIIRQAALGLAHVHERGMVHRDVKPGNLMVSARSDRLQPVPADSELSQPDDSRSEQCDGAACPTRPAEAGHYEREPSVKILDLGLALLGGQHGTAYELTTVGQFMGTLDYMAPEQADDSHEVDARADIYSLGATLCKLLTGHAPFAGPEFRSPVKKFKAVVLAPARDVRERRPEVPAELAGLIARMLAKNPDERPASAAEVARSLECFCRGADLAALLAAAEAREPADAGHGGGVPPVRGDGSSGGRRPEGGEPGPRARAGRRRRVVSLVLGMAAVLLAAAAVFVVRVQTDRGEVVIRSSDPDVQVLVKRGGEPVDDWQLQQGENRTSVRSGEYEVLLIGNTDGLSVRDGKFTLTRGGEQVVTIERTPAAERLADESQADLQILLSPEGRISIDGKPVAVDQLADHVRQASPQQVTIVAHRDVAALRVLDLIDLIRRAGVARISFAAADPGDGRAADSSRGRPEPSYGGKTYREAKHILQTERKPEIVAEAIETIAALADQGGYDEALRLILDGARYHGDPWIYGGPGGGTVRLKVVATLQTHFDSPEGAAAISRALTEGDRNDRIYLLNALGRQSMAPPGDTISVENARRAIPGLIAASHDDDPQVATTAINRLGELAPQNQRVINRLREALHDDEPQIQAAAAHWLATLDPKAQGLPAVLQGLLRREGQPPEARAATAELLARVDPDAEGLVEALIDLIRRDTDDPSNASARGLALATLASLGPRAASAVPALIEVLRDPHAAVQVHPGHGAGVGLMLPGRQQPRMKNHRVWAIEALGNIGPAARNALPNLRAINLPVVRDEDSIRAAREAIRRIEATPRDGSGAFDPDSSAAPAAAAAEPRYGGKTYREAKHILQTERKPEIVAEAIETIAALADQGGYHEPVRLILEAVRHHGDPWAADGRTPEGRVKQAAVSALHRLNSPEGLAAINKALQDGSRSDRIHLLRSLSLATPGRTGDLSREDVERPSARPSPTPPARRSGGIRPEDVGRVLPGVLAASHDEDARVRELALSRAFALAPQDAEVHARLEKALEDPHVGVVFTAAQNLAKVNPEAEGLISALARLLRELGDDDARSKAEAAETLARIDPTAEALVPALVDMIVQEDRESINWQIRGLALTVLSGLGPHAAPAVPVLIEVAQDEQSAQQVYPVDQSPWPGFAGRGGIETGGGMPPGFRSRPSGKRIRDLAVEALGNIGPAAREALPVLRALADEPLPSGGFGGTDARAIEARREIAAEAVRKITGEPEPQRESPPQD